MHQKPFVGYPKLVGRHTTGFWEILRRESLEQEMETKEMDGKR